MIKIGARKCTIKEIDFETTKSFLNKYHRQKSVYSLYNIGLFYESMLIGIMTFGYPRYNKRYQWELLRLCFHPEYRVVGGTIKMFNYFVDEYKPQSIVSYCDYNYFTGDIYDKLGFNLYRVDKEKLNGKGDGTYIWNSKGKFGYIYLITDTLHNKQYIGQRRGYKLDEQYYGSGRIIKDLIKKYGTNIFKREIIDYASSQEELSKKEIKYIEKYNTLYPNGYNLTLRLQAIDSYERDNKHSEESKRKISEASKEMWKDKEYREKQHKAVEDYWKDETHRKIHKERMIEITSSQKYKEKMSNSSKNNWKNEEYRNNVEEARKKVFATEEYHEKMRKINKENAQKKEVREKIAASLKELWKNKDLLKKASDNMKKRWEDKNYRKVHLEKIRKTMNTIEYKEKMRKIYKEKIDCEEFRKKLSIASKGRKWWNNGTTNVFQREKPEGDEWIPGRTKFKKNEK